MSAQPTDDASRACARSLTLDIPAEVLEALAERAAEIVLERLEPPAPASEFLTVAEAAELLRAEPQRVYDLCSSGRLKRFKDGSRVLISRAELVASLLPHGARARMNRSSAR